MYLLRNTEKKIIRTHKMNENVALVATVAIFLLFL